MSGLTMTISGLAIAMADDENGTPPPASASASDLAMRRSPRLSSHDDAHLTSCRNSAARRTIQNKKKKKGGPSFLIGDPIPDDEARNRWPYRYQNKRQKNDRGSSSFPNDNEDKLILDVKCHYSQAEIWKCVFDLGDCAFIKGEKGKKNFVGRIVEFFKTMDDEDYFRVQWFYRAEDTIIEDEAKSHDEKRLFISDLMNDNPLDCIISKVKIIQLPASV